MGKFILLVIMCICHMKNGLAKERIIGGEDAEQQEFPHQVSLRIDGRHQCGGSILDSRTILTAAHCLIGVEAFNGNHLRIGLTENKKDIIQIVVGTNFLSKGGTTYNVSKIFVHEKFNMDRLVNDVAILKLDTDIIFGPTVQRIELSGDPVENGTVLTLSGWGKTSFPGEAPEVLQKINLKAIDLETCYYKNPLNFPITLGQICTLSPVNYGSCKGDSGGPLINADQKMQVGIVSWGFPCAKGYPDVFTSVGYYKDWIRDKMKKL